MNTAGISSESRVCPQYFYDGIWVNVDYETKLIQVVTIISE